MVIDESLASQGTALEATTPPSKRTQRSPPTGIKNIAPDALDHVQSLILQGVKDEATEQEREKTSEELLKELSALQAKLQALEDETSPLRFPTSRTAAIRSRCDAKPLRFKTATSDRTPEREAFEPRP